jgi:hypothetical protein
MSFPTQSNLNFSVDLSSLYVQQYIVEVKKPLANFYNEEPLKISEKNLLIEENSFFLPFIVKYPKSFLSKNKLAFFYPTTMPTASIYFAGRALKLSQEMSIHLIERSSNLYTIFRKKEDWFFTEKFKKKGSFFEFFIANLTNVVVSFSRDVFAANLSDYSHQLKSQLLFFSKLPQNDRLNLFQLFYFSFFKKYNFLKKFYLYFYLQKNIINRVENKFKIFRNKFFKKRKIFLKNFLDNKFLNSKSIAIFFFFKKV